jgi:hypothetical protein
VPTFGTPSSCSLPFIYHRYYFINPLTITSFDVRCRGPEPLAQEYDTGPLYILGGVRTRAPTKSHSEYNCFSWSLKGFFTGTCNYEGITPGMTTGSVFIAWIIYLTSIVKWPLNSSSTIIHCFLNILDLLFRATSAPVWVEVFTVLLEYNAVWPAESRPMFRRNILPPSSGSKNGILLALFCDAEDGGDMFLLNAGWLSWITWCYIPEDRNSSTGIHSFQQFV